MPKPTAGMELPSPSETRESALVQVSEAMALSINIPVTTTNPANTAVAPSCGMQTNDAMQVKRNKNMCSRCNGCCQRSRIHVTRGAGDDRQKQLKMPKTKAKNRPLSVLRDGYWTAYGEHREFSVVHPQNTNKRVRASGTARRAAWTAQIGRLGQPRSHVFDNNTSRDCATTRTGDTGPPAAHGGD